MSVTTTDIESIALAEAAERLSDAAGARKCGACGCFHGALDSIEGSLPGERQPLALRQAVAAGRERLTPVRYDCLGCEVCFPAVALNALNRTEAYATEGAACATEAVQEREGWPPLPGDYTVLRYRAPVAICTLTDIDLATALTGRQPEGIAIVGSLQTENLGIERLVQNVMADPYIRFVVLCGPDSERAIGHLPGRSLLALAASGVDDGMRIVGAPGKRPVLKNVSLAVVEHFRSQVELVDLIGTTDVARILAEVAACAARDPGPSEAGPAGNNMQPVTGYVPEKMTSDPNGYFVIYVDRARGLLSLEHYHNTGVLSAMVEGRTAAELYVPTVERGLVSRLDHAAYLGKELARAERALEDGSAYVQDAAPEAKSAASCGCSGSCS